ncbi:MAG: FAD-dependent oxidoreductase [Rhodoferax sp.]|nr:FAD-dependent oxidoreductase [Rhodoferax sp.]
MNTARTIASAGEGHPLVIIGAGLAGWSTVREFRKLDATTPVLLITADSGDFYAKPSLSNAFAQKRALAQLITTPAATMAANHKVTLHAQTQVVSIDPVAQTIATSGGSFEYRQLVLATGAQAVRVPLSGNAAEQVLSVNSLDDFAIFHASLTDPCIGPDRSGPDSTVSRAKQVLIMGAGLIGCEFANDLTASGLQVSVVDPAARPMATLLPQEASEELGAALAKLGVGWHFGTTVKAVNRSPCVGSDTSQAALQVELSNGETMLADVVLSAIGLRADTALAQAAGLACERGILVDPLLQTSAPNIFALGDGAQYASAGGRTLPYVMPIMSAAKALAHTLSGSRTEVAFPVMPVTIKTPILPIVVAAPVPGAVGAWQRVEPGVWQFRDEDDRPLGFVLAGRQTARRAEQAKLLAD